MKVLKPSPHRARNDFDLSHRHILSANFGELLPISAIETVPGDHIELHASDLLRAMPLVTSPFMRAKQHIDVWFVPYTDLWSNFNQFITQKETPHSASLKGSSFLPHAEYFALSRYVAQSSEVDVVGRAVSQTNKKILNLLGYGDGGPQTSNTHMINLFRLAAYQYIWYNEYRQDYYDDGTRHLSPDKNAAYAFNFDDLSCDTVANALISDEDRLLALSKLNYRCWKKDLYTGLMPSTQFGDVSTVDVPNLKSRLRFVTDSNSNLNYRVLSVQSTGYLMGSTQVDNGEQPSTWFSEGAYLRAGTLESNFDVLALRRSEAVQIWRENALRSGNRVKDNMIGHYGVETSYDRDHRPTFLGSVSSTLNISDVESTAQTGASENGSLGDIAGKGLSSLDEKVFKFDAKDFGVIMVMFSMLPEAEYNATGIDRMNQLIEAEDFFVPEFENLGLEAVSSVNFINTPPSAAKIIGYAPRYYGYKQKLDKVFGDFIAANNSGGGIYSIWSSPKYDVNQTLAASGSAIALSTLYVNPRLFDHNFVSSIGTNDQFLCDFYFDVDAVRPMSVLGLPFS